MTTATGARYDGQADWYDRVTAGSEEHSEVVAELLGAAAGRCLDLGCGTGRYLGALASAGWQVYGADLSSDQLRLASTKGFPVVQADAGRLPFGGESFDAVAALWISTDVADLGSVLREVVRVLTPGGPLVLLGVHPCFNGPAVESTPDGGQVVHPTYRRGGWHESAPWWRPGGLRERLGVRHVPLAELLNTIVEAGLRIERATEPGMAPVPSTLGIRATKV